MAEFSYDIVEHCGQLSESAKGWRKELTKISWNERPAKYDIREWGPDYDKMSKGITLSTAELIALRDILNEMDLAE